MSKWRCLESDYMKANSPYLVHLSKNTSDHKYFVGVFTGRFKDTLYFRDAFDNEIELHIKDYLFDDGSFHIDFTPIKDVNDWAYNEPDDNESKFIKYNGVIKSIEKEDDLVTCTALINQEKKFKIDDLKDFVEVGLLDMLTLGKTVNIEAIEYEDESLPTLVVTYEK